MNDTLMDPRWQGRSYQGQDSFVLDALGGLTGGFFLDSGASGGFRGSNTFYLEKSFGWNGICVEPNRALFAELVQHRSCVCLNCCLYSQEGEVDFFEAAGVYGGILDEYDPGHLQFARSKAADDASLVRPTTHRLPARTLRSILHEHQAPSTIDYWSLDTEGSELTLLQSFPFDEYRFRVLTVEHNNGPQRDAIHVFLEAHGYLRVGTLAIDDCYMWQPPVSYQDWRSSVWRR